MEKDIIKIFGERNTGTNYLSALLDINFGVNLLRGTVPKTLNKIFHFLPHPENLRDIYFSSTSQSNLGWKHREIINPENLINSKLAKRTVFITLTKNPYSWLLSLYKRPYHQSIQSDQSFESFLTTKWVTNKRESNRNEYKNPIDLWNIKNLSYLSLGNEFNVMHIKYEDLLKNPEILLNKLATDFNLKLKNETIVNFESSTKDKSKDNSYYKNYYGKELWKNKLTKESIEIINKQLDSYLMDYFDYKFLNQ